MATLGNSTATQINILRNLTVNGTSTLSNTLFTGTTTHNSHMYLLEGKNILLRPNNANYTAGIGYDTNGNECLALWGKNTVTRLRWHAGVDMTNLTSGKMMSITPDFEISKADGTAKGYIGGNTIIHSGTIGSQSVNNATTSNKLKYATLLSTQDDIDNFIESNIFKVACFKTTEQNDLGFQSNDGMLLSIPWSTTQYGAQLAFDDVTALTIKARGRSTNWGNWYTLLHSGNYSSYALPIGGGTCTGSITATAFYESSDERLKDFEDDITVDIDKLKSIKKAYFRWKDNPDRLQLGVSAQSVKAVYPEIVSEDEDGMLTVAYDKLSVIALAAVDELNDTVKKLKTENQHIMDKLNAIENLIKSLNICDEKQ